MSRKWAMPSAWTFEIRPIKELLRRYVPYNGEGWADPFAGKNSPAELTNDLNPERNAKYHMDAFDFATNILEKENILLDGVLFDPPYSARQISEHYKEIGKKATALDTSANFYSRIKNKLAKQIKHGGYAISFGWNSVGFGKKNGFEIVEILLVSHGGSKNDTIVTVERKLEPRKEKKKLF